MPLDLGPLWLTLKLALVATAVLLVVGSPLAWWLAHTRSRIKAVVEATQQGISRRPGAFPRLVAVSAKSGEGLDVLRAEIAVLAR